MDRGAWQATVRGVGKDNLATRQPAQPGVSPWFADNDLLVVTCPHMVRGEGQVAARGYGGGGVSPFKGSNPITTTSPS